MDQGDPKPDFSGVVDSVMHLFGEVMSREAVSAIVEHYDGDLNQSIDAIMIMSDNEASANQQTTSSQPVQPAYNTSALNQHEAQISPFNMAASTTILQVSYAGASQRTCPKQPLNPKAPQPKQRKRNTNNNIWTLQTKQIMGYHAEGSRTLILMRGVPGSGKSYLAKQLLLTMCPESLFETHILSTDDFFYDAKGVYRHERTRLSEAHYWNQNRAIQAMRQGISPIFIDNTNVEIWEMQPYVREGINNGYIIEVLEPNTAWAKSAHLLAEKNTHKVPLGSIRRMLDNYQNGVSGLYLLRAFRLSYSSEKKPPVLRNFPPILPPNLPLNPSTNPPQQEHLVSPPTIQANIEAIPDISIQPAAEATVGQTNDTNSPGPSSSEIRVFYPASTNSMRVDSDDTENSTENSNAKHETAVEELVKRIEEIEYAWENGESWDVDGEENARGNSQERPNVPQPPRSSRNVVHTDKFLPSAVNYSDWSNISMFMPEWNDYQNKNSQNLPAIRVETATKGTSVEFGDTDTNNKNFKILIGTPKDINFYYLERNEEKIPEKRMLDKSSMTNDHDHIATEISRCKNEEKHFSAFRKLFKNISKVELRDIFDKCVGDVNWAVDIVLDGMANKQLQILDSDDISDPDDVGDDQCECLAAYNIIPNINAQPVANTPNPPPELEPEPIAGPSTARVKKEKLVLESSVQLKRQIEKNIVISDNHYSDHCLKIRKMRRGENYTRADSPENEPGTSTSAVPNATIDNVPETTNIDTDEEANVSDEGEKTVNVDLGSVFVNELDGMFGRDDMYYPENIETRVNMPVSLLNEINALWIESLTHQLDQQSRQSELMLRQDEEFARQLAAKEEELARAGQEPEVPSFKEIMDMELALSIYQKQVTEEWRNNEPNDLAARLTRDKLYNLFPEVKPEILSEMLMAHDNEFETTVEVLLSSTGKGHILEEPNGVNKFIAKTELKRQEKILAEQKKALSEAEWPLLPKDSNIDMTVVEKFRAKALEHLKQRDRNYQKAQDFYRRDMTQVATYFSDVASLHKKEFDHANSMAAASLMQYHTNNCADSLSIDLHFLKVAEAKESLDLFIDTNIKKLRESSGSGHGPRFYTLFIITGRGLHSRGGPRVKPAVIRRLKERGIGFAERNPGYLASKVFAENKMTFELA
ncbi:uncharacterized protein [Choristoneura fumiferana]|uniref:uncharacterized protein n=1 Tax=Choristoneura fumiferana TaxID=7141 RepID=UPI003D158FB8